MEQTRRSDRQRVILALSRLYNARLELLSLHSLREMLPRGVSTRYGRKEALVVSMLRLYTPRLLLLLLALMLAAASLRLFFPATGSADYLWGATTGALAFVFGGLSWALYANDRRIEVLSQRLLSELEAATGIQREIDEVVYQLEALLAPQQIGEKRR